MPEPSRDEETGRRVAESLAQRDERGGTSVHLARELRAEARTGGEDRAHEGSALGSRPGHLRLEGHGVEPIPLALRGLRQGPRVGPSAEAAQHGAVADEAQDRGGASQAQGQAGVAGLEHDRPLPGDPGEGDDAGAVQVLAQVQERLARAAGHRRGRVLGERASGVARQPVDTGRATSRVQPEPAVARALHVEGHGAPTGEPGLREVPADDQRTQLGERPVERDGVHGRQPSRPPATRRLSCGRRGCGTGGRGARGPPGRRPSAARPSPTSPVPRSPTKARAIARG